MASDDSVLPPCGLYRTTGAIDAAIPSERLVYFHNHGDPGPGVYLPESWALNRAKFSAQGHVLAPSQLRLLAPLLPEGMYRVTEEFTCCAEAHRTFGRDLLVQLGYDGRATPILFVPEWTARGLYFPERGQALDRDRLNKLVPLVVAESPGLAPPHLN